MTNNQPSNEVDEILFDFRHGLSLSSGIFWSHTDAVGNNAQATAKALLLAEVMECVESCMPLDNMKGTEMVLKAEVIQNIKQKFGEIDDNL
jgi:hypothetical protein